MFHRTVFPSSSSFKRAQGQSPASWREVNPHPEFKESPLATVLAPSDSPSLRPEPGTAQESSQRPSSSLCLFPQGSWIPSLGPPLPPCTYTEAGPVLPSPPTLLQAPSPAVYGAAQEGAPSSLPHPSPPLLPTLPPHCPSLITRISSALLNPTPLLPSPPQMSHL